MIQVYEFLRQLMLPIICYKYDDEEEVRKSQVFGWLLFMTEKRRRAMKEVGVVDLSLANIRQDGS